MLFNQLPVHMAKGKFRGSTPNNKTIPTTNGSFKGNDIFTTEFEINETPPSARTLLTKGYVQDEINTFSGATVSTRGRFMTEQEKIRCPNERPLYLYIQGQTKHNIDLAIQKINDIIKTEHQSSLNRPSRFTNAPPPLMSLHSGVPSVEKICVGIENAPQGFDLRGRIIGTGGANLLYIKGETGATVTLRGRGSQFIDPVLGTESPEPLHLYIEHQKSEALQNAKQLAINLIQTMQSELQSYIQQQPPPVQSQVLETTSIQQIQQAHFQTMNIGTLAQSNVVTIQHQDIIQHPQSTVVTLPATILTATMTGGPGTTTAVPPPGVHIPTHSGPLAPSSQSQEMQPVGQVQLIGPPPTVSQVQYQIHSGQPVHIQGIQMPPVSHSSSQPITQMYVMSQPPPPPPPPLPPPQNSGPPGFISSSSGSVNGAVSYVYSQCNNQRPMTPQESIETVNLQQPPPSVPLNVTHQPPPSLLHLHFPPPNFSPNQPPPPIPQTYQIQYQQIQTNGHQPTQFVLQSQESMIPQQMGQNLEPSQHHFIPHQFDNQPPPPPPPSQYTLQGPPPTSQTFMVSNNNSHPHPHPHQHPNPHVHPHPHPHQQQHQQPPMVIGGEVLHQSDGSVEQGPSPQPVPPPPQMVPPPNVNQMSNSINVMTNMPPPNQHPPLQNAPWLYQQQIPTQRPRQMPPPPPPQALHNGPHSQYQPHQMPFQNGHFPVQRHFEMHKPDSAEHQKGHGIKRRFIDVEGPQEVPSYPHGPPPTQRHGNGEGARQQQLMPGASSTDLGHQRGDRNKPLMPPSYPGEKRNMDQRHVGPNGGNERNFNGMVGQPWQGPWVRPPHMRPPRGQSDVDRSRSSPGATHNQMPPYSVKPTLHNSICTAPPPPPPPPLPYHQQRPQNNPSQYQTLCPPWMN